MLSFCVMAMAVTAQQTGTITGTVKGPDGSPLPGASVTVQGSPRRATTNNAGSYSLTLHAGNYTVVASFVGYGSARQSVALQVGETLTLNFALSEAGIGDAVVVTGSRSAPRTRTETPVPVDVIPIAQVVNEIGQVDLNQIINFIAPSFQSARQTISDGTDHVDPGQLRGLGPDQLLVLVNGKRRHQSALVNVNGTVNR